MTKTDAIHPLVKRFFAAAALSSVLALSSTAYPDSLGDKDVILTNGTRVRGRIEEIVPGERCVVRTSDGVRKFIQWSAIKRITEPGTPDVPEPQPEPEPPPPPPPPPPAKPAMQPDPPAPAPAAPRKMVVVDIKSSDSVRLEMAVGGGPWELACNSPCGVELPVDAAYRIMRDGDLVKGLRLDADGRDRIVLEVSVGSSTARGLGIAGLIIGTIMTYGAFLAAGNHDDDSSGPVVGVALAGLAIGVAGGIAFGTSGSSITQIPAMRTQESAKRDNALPIRGLGLSGPLFTYRF
jgi:hypothetical protein